MYQLKNILLLLFLWTFSWQLFAQQLDCTDQFPSEKIDLQLDKNICLAGDSIWFKAYCLQKNNTTSHLSKVLYLEIFNDSKKVFVQQKHELIDGKSWGVVAIPESVKTGYYYLRAYTQYMRNFSVLQYHSEELQIINPTLLPAPIAAATEIVEKANSDTNSNQVYRIPRVLAPRIEGLNKTYGRRDLINLNIHMPDQKMTNVSVVVRKKGLKTLEEEKVISKLENNPWLINSYASHLGALKLKDETGLDKILNDVNKMLENVEGSTSENQKLKYIPEIKNATISGLVIEKETKKPAPNIYCVASVIDRIPQIHVSSSKQDGSFIFNLNELEGTQNIFVSMKNVSAEKYELLINNDFSNDFPLIKPQALTFDSMQHQLVERLFLENELKINFKKVTQTEVFPADDFSPSRTNISDNNLKIVLSDFVNTPKMQDVFNELVPGVSVKKEAGQTRLFIFNKEEQRYYKSPIVLLDNVPVHNIDRLLKIDPIQVEDIEVIHSNYMLGEYMIDGLIFINTKTDDFAKYTWDDESAFLTYKTLSKSPAFYQSKYSSKKDRTPDFRNVLYWNPNIEFNGTSKELEFYTSDMTGEYEVVVHGYTKDGTPCYKRSFFKIQNELK